MEKFVKIMVVVNVLIVIGMLTGCEDNNITRQREVNSLCVVNLEGCEYIVSPNGHGSLYSHKGNCKNPIHVYARKEEDEAENEVKKNREEKRRKK